MTGQANFYLTTRPTGKGAPSLHRFFPAQGQVRGRRAVSGEATLASHATSAQAAGEQTVVFLDPSLLSPIAFAESSTQDWGAQPASQSALAPTSLSYGASSIVASDLVTTFATAAVAATGSSASTSDVSPFASSAKAITFSTSDGDSLFGHFVANPANIAHASSTVSAISFDAISTMTGSGAADSAASSSAQRFEAPWLAAAIDSPAAEVLDVLRAGGPSPARAPVVVAPPAATTLPTVTLSVAADKQTVVILDTGISSTIANLIYQYDFVSYDTNATTTVTHGSIVAAQVLAADSEANIIVLKVADDAGNISTSAVDSALDWVAKYASQLNIASVNLSFGASAVVTTATATTLSDEFATLSSLDVAVVVAAGNSASKSGVSALASDANVIAVSASNGDLIFSSYSNRDADLTDLVADGTNIAYGSSTVSGTSFSAPLVAGAISNLKDEFYTTYGRELTVKEALLLLQATGDAMSTTGEVAGTSSAAGDGYVQLDLAASLTAIHSLTELTLIGIVV